MRYFFEITYDGTKYNGWQNQINALGVQQVVEETLSKLLRDKISIVGSGRTDSGVHCIQQFFHADIQIEIKRQDFLQRLNSFLPKDIAIRDVLPVKPDAHARYDARERAYEYHMTTQKNPLLVGRAFYFFKECDISMIN
jgi:tRNA pseudouridine38-40 synthase